MNPAILVMLLLVIVLIIAAFCAGIALVAVAVHLANKIITTLRRLERRGFPIEPIEPKSP